MRTTSRDEGPTTPGKGGKGQRTPLEIEKAIRGFAREKFTPTQIHRLLEDNKKLLKGRNVPDLRTVQRIHRKAMPPDTSDPWSLADPEGNPEDAALILPVLAAATEESGGRWQRFSKDLAGWIVKVRVAAPDIPPLWAFSVAMAYWSGEKHKEAVDVEAFDQMLAFAPWRDKAHLRRYFLAVNMLHPEWFTRFEIAKNGEPAFTLSYIPAAEAVVIASAYSPTRKGRGAP
jgi:hypothetical protein